MYMFDWDGGRRVASLDAQEMRRLSGTMRLDLGDGVLHTIEAAFTR
jgi:hypothetical protein